MTHDLHKFMEQETAEIASEYERIYANSASDPGSAGDEGERNWVKLLKGWLPPTYHVATKGRLIGSRGELSPQVDVVVLKPSYPPKGREKAIWFAGGVAAAFECKNTLTASNIKDAVSRSLKFKNLFLDRKGSPFRELRSPLFYGLLAHSHAWKGAASTPIDNVDNALEEASLSVEHPRLLLDFLCVADAGSWRYHYVPAYKSRWMVGDFSESNPYDLVMSTFVKATLSSHQEKSLPFQPVGSLINALLQALAWNDHDMRDIASYYRMANLGGMGSGRMRPWALADVYSTAVAAAVSQGKATSSQPWDEWSMVSGGL